MVTVTPVSESRLVRSKIELVLPTLMSAGVRLFRHPRIAELYPHYLFMSHCIIRASVPLMELGRDVALRRQGDRVAALVADYLDTHIPEERGHDEWLLEDLESLGVAREEVLSRPPSPSVASLVGSQYYWIQHYHPVALLGYITLLEGYPPIASEIEELQRRTGYGPAAFRTLSLHGELDPHHGAELDAVLDSLPLTAAQRTSLGLSAIASVQLMTNAVEEVIDRLPERA
jgi:pyrroloquinoline quinone (PQQ) biosynthesis protein C